MSIKSAGIDIGSRTVKVVLVEDGQMTLTRKRENSFDPLAVCEALLDGLSYDIMTATGYGRHLFCDHFDCEVISEIKAFTLGSRFLFPPCRTVLDIGGQDMKAMVLEPDGRVRKFEMNDKCAAGTGRFLEMMAMALGCSLGDLGELALSAQNGEKINSMCTVFAESEVVSMLARGAAREDVALGVHRAIVDRSMTMLERVGIEDDVVFVGGVALNPCVHKLLERACGRPVTVPDDPQVVGALGCALHGAAHARQGSSHISDESLD